MRVKRIIRKITEEWKQEGIRICLPGFCTENSYFNYSDFEQLSLEELAKKWIIQMKEILKMEKRVAKVEQWEKEKNKIILEGKKTPNSLPPFRLYYTKAKNIPEITPNNPKT